MPEKHPLSSHIPEQAIPYVESLLENTRVTIYITGQRKSKHGSFSEKGRDGRFRITVSRNNNPYAFLFTLIHEIAHLKVFSIYGRKALPHGEEWKDCFRQLMLPLLKDKIFPEDLTIVLANHLLNPAASSGTDPLLVKFMARYDHAGGNGHVFVDTLKDGESFIFHNRKFTRLHLIRKRIKCREESTKKIYLFSPVAEVLPLRS